MGLSPMKNGNFIVLCDDDFHYDLMNLAPFQAFRQHETFIKVHYLPGELRKVYASSGLWNKKFATNIQY